MRLVVALLLALVAPLAFGADPLSIPAITLGTGANGQQEYSVSLQILLIMTALSFIPAFVMLMTSFTRIIIVFSILRQALGLQQTPSNQILTGMALSLTMFIMAPVFDRVNNDALQPYLAEKRLEPAHGQGRCRFQLAFGDGLNARTNYFRGERVTVVANHGDIHASTAGEAQQDGRLGMVIRVRNIASGKIIEASRPVVEWLQGQQVDRITQQVHDKEGTDQRQRYRHQWHDHRAQ